MDSDNVRSIDVVLYDDRPTSLTGLKIAAASLRAHSPGLRVHAIAANAPASFRSWAATQGVLVTDPPRDLRATGWDVKPSILLHMLDRGAEEVLWFDTDIVATRDIRPLLAPFGPETVVATEEYYWGYHQGSPTRTMRLGLEVGRVLPRSLNSGILRVASAHRPLLSDWANALADPAYLAAQSAPVHRRPIVYLGDQEVLGGLLGSQRYADVPLALLRRGVEIAQCFGPSGFTVKERWNSRSALPTLVHAMGRKPWSRPSAQDGRLVHRLAAAWQNAHLDLTPYQDAARPYLASLDEDADWAIPHTSLGRALSRVDSPALRELPLTMIDSSQRAVRRVLGIRQVPA